ncbi:MAG: hypothetical protein WBC04_13230 [Candidatus Acidiferrales bacterium]
MKVTCQGVFGGLVIAFIVAVLPGRGQTNCALNQAAAVQRCFAHTVKAQPATPQAGTMLRQH